MKTTQLYKDVAFDSTRPVVTIVLETDFTKEIRIVMQKGTQMKEHKTKFPIVVNVVEGNIDFGVHGEVLQLSKGNLIALESNVPHNLMASEDSIVRLTLTKYDNAQRIHNVVDSH